MIEKSTLVTFPQGDLVGESTVCMVTDYREGQGRAVVVAETPFHPVDHRWPDQPGDTGVIEVGDRRIDVVDCVVGAVAAEIADLRVGSEIGVKRGEPGWHWVVVHVIGTGLDLGEGVVRLEVDAPRRLALSAAHTACHLSGFALNTALAELWSRVPGRDALGFPDFDGTALARSEISVDGFHDTYRLGRSLRKAGFPTQALPELVPRLGERLTDWITERVAGDGDIRVEVEGPELSAPRSWVCDLPDGTVRLACGGTHPRSLGSLGSARITAELAADGAELHVRGIISAA